MALLNEAYETLSDPKKRHEFDLKWEAFQQADVEQNVHVTVVDGYLKAGDTPAYSHEFRQQHRTLVNQFARAPLKRTVARHPFQDFQSEFYSFKNAFGVSETFSDIFSFLEAQTVRQRTQTSPPPPKAPLTPMIAVTLLMDFLAGHYMGSGLSAMQQYL